MRSLAAFLFLAFTVSAGAQFDLQHSGVSASLRGIDSVGPGIAWASGSDGTVLRTEDGGYIWQGCAKPKGGETLDFRGVQGFDAQTAVIMSSGKGALSRIYKTTDGCQTWKLVFTAPDEGSFFDAMRRVTSRQMYVAGDPVEGKFQMFYSPDQGTTWDISDDPVLNAAAGAGAFAASNSALGSVGPALFFGTGGQDQARVYVSGPACAAGVKATAGCPMGWSGADVPMAGSSEGAGVFSVAARSLTDESGKFNIGLVAVGGDYKQPAAALKTAAWSKDHGRHWTAAVEPPHGYRSAVVYDRTAGTWLAVGPNGADISRDDGAHWTALSGDTAAGWNAISLPFVVGAKGAIGKVRDGVLSGKP